MAAVAAIAVVVVRVVGGTVVVIVVVLENLQPAKTVWLLEGNGGMGYGDYYWG